MNLKSYLEELLDGSISGVGGRSTVRRIENHEEFMRLTKDGTRSRRGIVTPAYLYMATSDTVIHTDILEFLHKRGLVDHGQAGAYAEFADELDYYLTVISHDDRLYLGESYPYYNASEFSVEDRKKINRYANIIKRLGISFIGKYRYK